MHLGVPEIALILLIAFFVFGAEALIGRSDVDPGPRTFNARFFIVLGLMLALFGLVEFWFPIGN